MGVSGSGKTTVGRLLAESLGWRYLDADDFHSTDNVEKMRRGVALDDHDREPWLETLRNVERDHLMRGEPAVLACSALKESYRAKLKIDDRVKFVYLKGDFELIAERQAARPEHYMSPSLLESQFATLEEPIDVFEIDVRLSPQEIVKNIRRHFSI